MNNLIFCINIGENKCICQKYDFAEPKKLKWGIWVWIRRRFRIWGSKWANLDNVTTCTTDTCLKKWSTRETDDRCDQKARSEDERKTSWRSDYLWRFEINRNSDFFRSIEHMRENVKNHRKLIKIIKIAQNRQKLTKIVKNWPKSFKIAQNR